MSPRDEYSMGLAQEREDDRRHEQAERDEADAWAALDDTAACDAWRRAQQARWQRIAGLVANGPDDAGDAA